MQKVLIPTPAEMLLSLADEKVDLIKQASGARPEIWSAFFMPLLTAFAENVQRLPLSPEVFASENGALDFGLVCARVALQLASTQVFSPEAKSEERRVLEPQCHFAAFAASLSTAVAMVAQNVSVRSSDGKSDYHPLVTPVTLQKWLTYNPDSTIEWRTTAAPLTSPEAAAIAARFIPAGLLNNFDLRVSLMIFGSIAPQLASNGLESTLSRVVRLTVTRVIEHQQDLDRKTYLGSSHGMQRPATTGPTVSAIPTASQPAPGAPATAPTPVGAEGQAHGSETNIGTSAESANQMLDKAHPALVEWFKAVKAHDKFDDLKQHITKNERGIELPINILGKFGVNGAIVRKMLQDAALIVDRTEDSRGIILQPGLAPLFFDSVPQ